MVLIPSNVTIAAQQLGWQIVGPPRLHPEGVVYLCRDAAGITEPYTETAIFDELTRMKRFARLVLLAADCPPEFATVAACLRNTQFPILNILPQEATP
jgi:hypothetical protein